MLVPYLMIAPAPRRPIRLRSGPRSDSGQRPMAATQGNRRWRNREYRGAKGHQHVCSHARLVTMDLALQAHHRPKTAATRSRVEMSTWNGRSVGTPGTPSGQASLGRSTPAGCRAQCSRRLGPHRVGGPAVRAGTIP